MQGKQLNVWISEELRDYVAKRAEQEQRGMNAIIAELIREDMARRDGQLAEQSSLIVVREIVASELQKATAQLRHDLREDRQYEAESGREWLKKQCDRLAGLMIMAIRNSSISRRLTFTLLSKAHGIEYAQKAQKFASEKAHEELLPKKAGNLPVPMNDDESVS